jgi:hypothetical protein
MFCCFKAIADHLGLSKTLPGVLVCEVDLNLNRQTKVRSVHVLWLDCYCFYFYLIERFTLLSLLSVRTSGDSK